MALQTINIGVSANDGSGDPLRTAMDKINDNFGAAGTGVFNVTHPDYGAVGNGVANDTAAINAASAAAALVGGVVKFPFTEDSYNFTFTLPDAGVRWEFDGDGDLIDRSQLGGSAGMRAHKAMLVHFGGPHTSFSQVANHIRVIADGSTQNGPSSADFCQTLHVEKKDYLTTSIAGEIDGQYIFVRQGGPNVGEKSAAAAQVIDVVGVDGCGFIGVSEAVVYLVNSSGVTQKNINIQTGILNGRDGDYHGVIYTSKAGTQESAVYIHNESGSTWGDSIWVQDASGILRYKVGMDGKITTKTDNTGNTEINWLNTAGSLDFKTNAGNLRFSINQDVAIGPILAGGTGTTSTLTLRSTTGVGTTGADIIFQVGNNGATEAARILNSGLIGINTNAPKGQLHVMRTSAGTSTSVLTIGNSATNNDTAAKLAFNLSTNLASQTAMIEGKRTNSPASSAARINIITSDGGANHTIAADERGCLALEKTNTAAGTTGNQTIDKASGRVNIAAAGTSVTVTNAAVTTASNVVAWLLTNDTTAKSCSVQPGSGSFVITLNAAATAEVALAFVVFN